MKKIKLFYSSNDPNRPLEDRVNRFCEKNSVIDISIARSETEQDGTTVIMVVYEE